jgi:hypothetical protein
MSPALLIRSLDLHPSLLQRFFSSEAMQPPSLASGQEPCFEASIFSQEPAKAFWLLFLSLNLPSGEDKDLHTTEASRSKDLSSNTSRQRCLCWAVHTTKDRRFIHTTEKDKGPELLVSQESLLHLLASPGKDKYLWGFWYLFNSAPFCVEER